MRPFRTIEERRGVEAPGYQPPGDEPISTPQPSTPATGRPSVAHRSSSTRALILVLAIMAGGAWVGVKLINAVTSSGTHAGARARLIDHHCTTARDGSVLVSGQIANDGRTGLVQASAYVLLSGGQKADAGTGWNAYDKSLPSGSSDFFSADVPTKPGDQVLGCGVLIGSVYSGDGA